ENCLVLGGGLLIVGFPGPDGLIHGELCLPDPAMLSGLMLGGVAFEFRVNARGAARELRGWAFSAGALAASFAPGLMRERYVPGLQPGIGYWLFAVLVGASVCGAYVLMGASWLVMKTEGALQEKAHAWTRWGLLWGALGVGLISLGTPLVSETV